MDFKSATDQLVRSGTVNLTQVADEFGITLNSISRMRRGTLRPPQSWEQRIAMMARHHAKNLSSEIQHLRELADELERGG